MAGVSFLYAFSNLYSMDDGEGVPTLEEAQLDLESCQAVLAYLAREPCIPATRGLSSPDLARVPSAGACHDTMQNLSKAILDQLAAADPPAVQDGNLAWPHPVRSPCVILSSRSPTE